MNSQQLYEQCLREQSSFIRASQVAQVTKSPFVLWADEHAPTNKKDSASAFQEMLFAKGDEHEQAVINQDFADATELAYTDAREGFLSVLNELFAGTKLLTQTPLFYAPEGLRGRPDVLMRVDGESVFGAYHYVVKEIKYAKNLKDHHRLQAAYYTYLLGLIQGRTPKYFTLINYDQEEFTYPFEEYKEQLFAAIAQAKEVLSQETPPLPVYGEAWPWEEYSKELAVANDDVSQVYRLGRSVRERLQAVGIFTLADLAQADASQVLAVNGVGKATYTRWMRHVQALRSDEPVWVRKPSFPRASQELFFDVEGDTELGIDYLYGLLDGDDFVYFWADKPDDEQLLWEEFLSYVDSLPVDTVIYYYTSYERQSLARMRARYGCADALWKKLSGMLVDLFPLLRQAVVLPLASYSIKPVAQYLGFSWRAVDASGANSLEWYARYLQGEDSFKQKLLAYNEDDVRATRVVKQWLAKQR